MASIHDGHRERLRQRYQDHGADSFTDHELLELLLTYAIPRRDTNETAHLLLKRFGSLSGVVTASPEQLQTVSGIGRAAAQYLHLQGTLQRRIALRRLTQRNGKLLLNTPNRTARYAELLLRQETNERMFVLCLSAQRTLLSARPVGSGSLSEMTIYPRTIVELAILQHAHSVILVHNHPSGDPTPSQADADTTESIRARSKASTFRCSTTSSSATAICTALRRRRCCIRSASRSKCSPPGIIPCAVRNRRLPSPSLWRSITAHRRAAQRSARWQTKPCRPTWPAGLSFLFPTLRRPAPPTRSGR